ncbi:MAG: outer membrane beta-barrel protein [Alphaproteobacteria bacterium]
MASARRPIGPVRRIDPKTAPALSPRGQRAAGWAISAGTAAAVLSATLIVLGALSPRAVQADEIRPYIAIRAGGELYTDRKAVPELYLDGPSEGLPYSFSAGFDWGRYLGAELALDFRESNLTPPGAAAYSVEYAIWDVLAQMRLRYPLFGDRLVPYLLAGGGIGLGEPNDRNPNAPVNVNGGMDSSPVAVAGAGIEYFFAPNMAFGFEVKHVFLFETDIRVGGQPRELQLDSLDYTAGLRVYFDDAERAKAEGRPPAADSDAVRAYLSLRLGAQFLMDGDSDLGVELANPAAPAGSTSIGVNLGKYWGLELAGDAVETLVTTPRFGQVAEMTMWTMLGQVRLRYPVMEDRLSPYVVLGGGFGVTELSDRRINQSTFRFDIEERQATPVAAIGAGVDYFIAHNIALGAEAKHVLLFDADARLGDQPGSIELDPVVLTAGIKVFFP